MSTSCAPLVAEEGPSASSGDSELKARLVAAFCPALRFDAAEKHFPVSAESFLSSSLLLRRGHAPKQRRRRRPPRGSGAPRRARHNGNASSGGSSGSSSPDDVGGGDGGGGGGGDGGTRVRSEAHARLAHAASSAEGETDTISSRNQSGQGEGGGVGQGGGQACGECGSRQGWKLPDCKDWTVIPLPEECERWGTGELLVEQGRGGRYKFRLEPHCCIWDGQAGDLSAVPCYAFAEALDMSAVAPFLRRSGIGPIYEIKYAFLYGYNGTTFAVPGTSVGVHTGDLEHVTIRVDAARMMILEAFFAAHSTGEGKWVPSRDFYRQVQALEATAYPGQAAEVPESAREFLETESATALGGGTNARQDADSPEACLGVGGALDGVIERLVIYPARNGHASYHMPKRWRRFGGLGDDVCRGDGVVWRPSPVQLDHPAGKTPPWLQFRGRFGAAGCIPLEGFWKSQGEPLRRCSAEAKYRSLLEEGLVPDRGLRIGAVRRMLQGNGDRGVWLERCRQTENRLPFFNTWAKVPGVGAGRPRNQDPPRATGRVWLHDWDFVLDLEGGTTDAKGWSYHVMADRYADTGVTGKAKVSGIAGHRARGRVWFRVAATPSIAREMEEAYRQGNGLYPRSLLGLAALDVSGKGDTVTAESILQTLQGDIASPARGTVVSGDASRRLRATSSNAVAAREGGGGGGVSDESMTSFGNVARRNLGLS